MHFTQFMGNPIGMIFVQWRDINKMLAKRLNDYSIKPFPSERFIISTVIPMMVITVCSRVENTVMCVQVCVSFKWLAELIEKYPKTVSYFTPALSILHVNKWRIIDSPVSTKMICN